MRQKSLIDIFILKILSQYSSQTHKLRQVDILYYLNRDYDLCVNRNTLSHYIKELKEYGFVGGDRGLYLIRTFTNSEIKMILDTLMYSRAIPYKNVQDMINRLKNMAEPEYRKLLNRITFVDSIDYIENENISHLVEQISQAIDQCRKIEITTCKYTIQGELIDTGKRIVNPYYIVIEKSRYYLLCYANRGDVEPRRIDRISKVRILNEPRLEIYQISKYANHNFQLSNYLREHIYMYSGDEERITIRIHIDNIGDFIDWYGKNYRIVQYDADDSEAVIQIRANTNAVYFWALQYGGVAEVLGPESLRRKIREGLEEMLGRYKKRPAIASLKSTPVEAPKSD